VDDVTILRLLMVVAAGAILVRAYRRQAQSPKAPPRGEGSNVPLPLHASREKRAQRYRNAAYVSGTIGFLLMLGWMTVRTHGWLQTSFLVAGITALAAGFVLSGMAGWIGAGPDP